MSRPRDTRDVADVLAAAARASGVDDLDPAEVRRLAGLPPPPSLAREPAPSRRIETVNRPNKARSEAERARARDARRSRLARVMLAYALASARPAPTESAARVRFLAAVQRDRPGCEGFAPRSFASDAFALGKWLCGDTSGNNARAILAELPPRFARALERAALCEPTHDEDGELVLAEVRTLRSLVARRRILFGVIVYRGGSMCRRRGFAARLEGFARGTWGVLAKSRDTGKQAGRRALDDDFRALRLSGAIYVEQPPAHAVPRAYVGRDRDGRRRALAVYYVPTSMVGRRRLRRLRGELAEVHGPGTDDAPDPAHVAAVSAALGGAVGLPMPAAPPERPPPL